MQRLRPLGHGFARVAAPGLAAARRHSAARCPPPSGCGLRPLLTAAAGAPAPAETPTEILQSLLQDQSRVISAADGGLLRASLPGPVAVGQAVEVAGSLGFVVSYDRRGARVALVSDEAATPVAVGAGAALGASLGVRGVELRPGAVAFASVAELVVQEPGGAGADGVDGRSAPSVGLLRLPPPPPPPRRRPVTRPLPSGLPALEALAPLGEGHRVGLVGPPSTGKTTAARMVLASQGPDTAVVYAAQRPLETLRQQIPAAGAGAAVVYADPARASLGSRYLLPLCAARVAAQLLERHRHVLLVLDDLAAFAGAALELQTPPLGAPHALAAVLDAAGRVEGVLGAERALSVAAVLDFAPEEDLPPFLRDLWRGAEPSLDVRVAFEPRLAARGVLPAVDVDGLLAGGASPAWQPPVLRQLRAELLRTGLGARDLRRRVELSEGLGLHTEPQDEEDLISATCARAVLLAHEAARPLPEALVLVCAALVFHFPGGRGRPPPRTAVADFQAAVIALVRKGYPRLWEDLRSAQGLSEAEARRLIREVGEALLAHRLDFRLTLPQL